METTITDDSMQIIVDTEFSFEGYQVVRGEFFAHIYEPSITFNNYKVAVNTACIKKLPEVNYVQILVNPNTKKLAVRPCREDEKDSLRWSTAAHKPKQITCRVFFAKVFSLMQWNPHYRYKLIGKLIKSESDLLFVYDLNTPEIFQRTIKEDGKVKTSRTASYPEEWKNQFGIEVQEHQKTLQVDIFKDYAVFSLESPTEKSNRSAKTTADTLPDSDTVAMQPQQNSVVDTTTVQPPEPEESYEQLSITNTGVSTSDSN